MKISVVSGAPEARASDVIAFAVFAPPAPKTDGKKPGRGKGPGRLGAQLDAVDQAMGNVLVSAAEAEGFAGEVGQVYSMHTHGRLKASRVVLVGMGPRDGDHARSGPDVYRKLGGTAVRAALHSRARRVAIALPDDDNVRAETRVEALAEGAMLAGYRFDRYLSNARDAPTVDEVEIVAPRKLGADRALARAAAVAEGVCLARDLVNEPPATLTPARFAEVAKAVGKKAGLAVTVLTEVEIKKERMGMLLAVSAAAAPYHPPRVVKISYKPKGTKAKRHIALVGKGLTFDSGGLDIKPSAGMLDMKIDMSGAAAVLGAMLAIGRLRPDVQVTGYLGCVENGIGGNAYHPGDVLTSRKGLTVEINNTDAEGRLVLADVIDYALTHGGKADKPDVLIDLATLTGACMVALGPTTAGLFSDDDTLAEDIRSAGRRAGEDFWRLPLNEDLFSQLKSNIADMKNTGERYGGAITAALFLKQFVDGRVRWAHLDIAGPAATEKEAEYIAKGGTGFGVRTLMGVVDPG